MLAGIVILLIVLAVLAFFGVLQLIVEALIALINAIPEALWFLILLAVALWVIFVYLPSRNR